MRTRTALSALCLLLLLLGCGWGGDPRDFLLTVSPATLSAVQGGDSAAVSLRVTRIAYFNASVTTTFTPPTGIVCSLSPCTVTLTDQAANALHFTAAANTSVGDYTVPWSAQSSGIAAHTGSVTLHVSAATSGGGGTPPPVADFSLTVLPATASVLAGTPTPAFSFTVTRSGGQTAAVRVTASLPSAWTCSISPCGTTVTGATVSNAFTVTPAASIAAGTYSILFTATDGTQTHTVSVSVTVTAPIVIPPVTVADVPSGCMVKPYKPTMPIGSDRQGFVYTGAQNPKGLVYDAAHNLVFESNDNLNEVDVIDPNTMTLIHRIPVPGPKGLDLAPDGKTLLVGSSTPAFFRVDTGTFCVTARVDLPVKFDWFGATEYTPYKVLALSDGSVALWMQETNVGSGYFSIWTASGGLSQKTFTTGYLGCMLRSGDYNHVYLCGGDSGGLYGRYDVGTGAVLQKTISFGDFPYIYAVNQDGSRILTGGSYGAYGLTLRDAEFNSLALDAGGSGYNLIATPDFSRIYEETQGNGSLWRVLDGQPAGSTLTRLGSIPGFLSYAHVDPTPYAFDGTGRILSTVEHGLGVLPVRDPRQDVISLGLRSGYAPVNSGLTPDNPSAGFATIVNGANFITGPEVYFGGIAGTGSQLVTTGPFQGTQISTTAPSLSADCVNVEVSYPNAAVMEPLSYCYRPRVLYSAGNAAPASGGTTVTLFGMGFGDVSFGNQSKTIVRVGGSPASNVQVKWLGISPYALQLYQLTATVPAGSPGLADIEVASPSGSTVLPKAFTYADSTETSLGTADPYEMIFDASRERLFITDQAGKQLLVYSTTGKRMESPVALSGAPRGVALTPDGSRLLITVGRDSLAILDAATLQIQKVSTVPPGVLSMNDPQQQGMLRVAALANGKAFVEFNNIYIGNTLLQYDLATGTFTYRSDMMLNGVQDEQDVSASADGMWAFAGGTIYSTQTDKFTVPGYYFIGSNGVVASPDGSRFGSADSIYGRGLNRTALLSDHDLLTGLFSNGFGGAGLPSGQFNAGTSLYFQRTEVGTGITLPTQPGTRVWDVQHGKLIFQMGLPGASSAGGNSWSYRRLLAVDPRGQRFWTITSRGLEDIQLAQDPLTVGTLNLANGTLSVQGSGFTSTMTVTVDGQPLTANVSGTTAFTSTVPPLASGNHVLQVTDGPDRVYTLDLAFSTP